MLINSFSYLFATRRSRTASFLSCYAIRLTSCSDSLRLPVPLNCHILLIMALIALPEGFNVTLLRPPHPLQQEQLKQRFSRLRVILSFL